jgi:lysophospholipase L1-like esterase
LLAKHYPVAMAASLRSRIARLAVYGGVLVLAGLVYWLHGAGYAGSSPTSIPYRIRLDDTALAMIERDARVPAGAVIFLGDSLTRALDVGRIAPGAINYGIDGYQTRHLLAFLPKLRSVPRARLVVLTIGTNDVKRHQLEGIEERLHRISQAIPGPLLWNAIPPSRQGEVARVNAAVRRECAARSNCTYLETKFEATDFWDGEHPNVAGNERWSASMRRAWPLHGEGH